MKKALLLSGGVDSTALAWWMRPDLAYTVDYGHAAAEAEILTAKYVCKLLRCPHHIIHVDISALGTGPLAGRKPSKLSAHEEWWPFRNQLLLTLVGMDAVQRKMSQLLIGTVRTDSRHRDGRPSFISGISTLMSRQEGGLLIQAPAQQLDAKKLLLKARIPEAVLLRTHSCHRGNTHCGRCSGCAKRLALFQEIGLTE